ncbi:OmpA family protein [Hymenobacter taeanensis]|uniref:OmpA family protein n=1 Tax=Hymenobacter taeanensis TaxID=2735321 RepID=A0A6M6BL01_9BACT|nr:MULTISPECIES: OmpA family protein [Hymenobacter]QJX48528.1 OmpA family protein [Hymenobacter taeanensis]UOQ81974.1 OmpA family protein [Hymenobacter sp. 5414T-23]
MKSISWYVLLIPLLLGVAPAHAQSLAGIWQGVETDTGEREPNATWPAELRLQKGKGNTLFGVLYQQVGGQPWVTVTFKVQATPTPTGMELMHQQKLNETGRTPGSYWCEGSITFTYDPKLERLTGHATYTPIGNCDIGTFTFYRVKLKSPAKVAAGVESTIRVSGRNVLWYADADLKQPVTTGNTYRTKLTKTTTFYLTQGYYPTRQSAVVPITIQVTGKAPARPPATPVAPTRPEVARADTARPVLAPVLAPQPVVLPTVLFKLGTPELLPEGLPALDQLAAELKARPLLKLRVAGHTDKIGEPEKNLVLSEQRAEAVKAYLVKAGVAAERLSTVGYGDSRPLYPSPDARNRRVEVEEIK